MICKGFADKPNPQFICVYCRWECEFSISFSRLLKKWPVGVR